MKQLATAANAQANMEAGRNVTSNLAKSNENFDAAANSFKKTAVKLKNLRLNTEAAEFNKAANAATVASAIVSARHAKRGLTSLVNKMQKNINAMNLNRAPPNAAGLA